MEQIIPISDCWTPADLWLVREVRSFGELPAIAINVIRRLPGKRHALSGPISTGGFECSEKNLALFDACTRIALARGVSVFNLIPLQIAITPLVKYWRRVTGNTGYCQEVLDEIYRPIFESGEIHGALMFPTYQTSTGALWERMQFTRLNIPIENYPDEWFAEAVNSIADIAAVTTQ